MSTSRDAPAAAEENGSSPRARYHDRSTRRATAEISASVFLVLRRTNAERSIGSGRTPENSLVCLTCPAMRACEIPASFRMATHRPSCPSETQYSSAGRPVATASDIPGSASSRIPITVTSCPKLRAASSARNGNRPLPAIRPMRIVDCLLREVAGPTGLLVDSYWLHALGGPAKIDTALGSPDEFHKIHYLRTLQRRIGLDAAQRARRVEF